MRVRLHRGCRLTTKYFYPLSSLFPVTTFVITSFSTVALLARDTSVNLSRVGANFSYLRFGSSKTKKRTHCYVLYFSRNSAFLVSTALPVPAGSGDYITRVRYRKAESKTCPCARATNRTFVDTDRELCMLRGYALPFA